MPMIVASSEVESVLREQLSTVGYRLTGQRLFGETGTDIIASREGESLHIETISFKSSGPQRAKDFYEVFFRATSRLSRGATRCVIALPARFGNGLRQRAATLGPAWGRIGTAFPELEIWLVDTEARTFRVTQWNTWMEVAD